jgi:hypothetical protein
VPLQIEGTKTFNYRAGAQAPEDVPETTLVTLLPLAALLMLATVAAVRRRRNHA